MAPGEGHDRKGFPALVGGCSAGFRDDFGILASGEVTTCCVDYDEQFIAGRLDGGDAVGPTFSGPTYRRFRQEQASGRFGPLCESCGFSNVLVDWFEDELNQHVEAHRAPLCDERLDGRFHEWLRGLIDRFDRLADGA